MGRESALCGSTPFAVSRICLAQVTTAVLFHTQTMRGRRSVRSVTMWGVSESHKIGRALIFCFCRG